MLNKEKIINQFQNKKSDTGSTQVQIALLTEKIKDLTKHFQIHKKDFHSMRGLIKMVSQRKKLLSYIKRKNKEKYLNLIKELSLRK